MTKATAKPADIKHAQLHAEAADHPTDREIIALGRRRFGLD